MKFPKLEQAAIKTLREHEVYVDRENNGRMYYLLPTGKKRYVRHDPIASLMRQGLVTEKDGHVFIDKWGEIVINDGK